MTDDRKGDRYVRVYIFKPPKFIGRLIGLLFGVFGKSAA